MEEIKIAISSAIQLGGSLYTPDRLKNIGGRLGPNKKVEMTPFRQLYAEVPINQREAITEELERNGLEVNPAGFVTKSLFDYNFCKGAEEARLETAKK
ncbi:hypothetical protein [Paenibacillus solani]|uniref:hypothetical protein n=1 Tax=Paenibacillus solani TaxID=1705565 RepID=UPI0006C8D744|nr:hypothetical protein [Paenibacillus solani]